MLIFLAIAATMICYIVAMDANNFTMHFVINKFRRLDELGKIEYILETKKTELKVRKEDYEKIKSFEYYEFDKKGRLR